MGEIDEVYVKLNCEGSEVDIIEDLLDSNEYRKVTSLGVSFDVRKIPSQRHREQEIKTRLQDAGYHQWVDLESVIKALDGTPYGNGWLWQARTGARSASNATRGLLLANFSSSTDAVFAATFVSLPTAGCQLTICPWRLAISD